MLNARINLFIRNVFSPIFVNHMNHNGNGINLPCCRTCAQYFVHGIQSVLKSRNGLPLLFEKLIGKTFIGCGGGFSGLVQI